MLCDLAHTPADAHDDLRRLCQELATEGADPQVWRYLAVAYLLGDHPQPDERVVATLGNVLPELATVTTENLIGPARHIRDAGRQRYLLDRAATGQGMKWGDTCALMGTDRLEEVDAAFDRNEPLVGVAVIGLALNHTDPQAILPRVAQAMAHHNPEIRTQATITLAHTARLHQTVDDATLNLLRDCPRGNPADDDLWTFIPRRQLPWWLWRHHLPSMVAVSYRSKRSRQRQSSSPLQHHSEPNEANRKGCASSPTPTMPACHVSVASRCICQAGS